MYELLIALATIIISILLYFKYTYNYWSRKNVPFLTPKIPLGNSPSFLARGIGIGGASKDWYDKLKKQGHKFGGIYTVLQPTLLLVDPDYVRDILSVDFSNFVNRGIYYNEKDDPISANLFSQDSEAWRKLRIKLTPTFTSGKMKTMFNSIVNCSNYLKEALGDLAQKKADVDIHEAAACFTTDVIGCCAFGLDCNSFKEPNAEFRLQGKNIFVFNVWYALKLFLTVNTPKLATKLRLRRTKKSTETFFKGIIQNTVDYREQNNVSRVDFLQMLIELKNHVAVSQKMTMDEITAQCFLFFIAGFETSSTTMMYTLLEVAQNMQVQKKIRKEIEEVLGKYNGEITYEAIMEMKYLTQVIDESLRLYPPVPTLNRICTKDYKLRDSDVVIEKGTPIFVSALGLHRDPEYYKDPYKWDPERFNEENKQQRHPYVYIPFGNGPRNCIGLRFGLMQTKIGLMSIIKNFKVTLSPKTILPVGVNMEAFLLVPLNKIYLNLEKI